MEPEHRSTMTSFGRASRPAQGRHLDTLGNRPGVAATTGRIVTVTNDDESYDNVSDFLGLSQQRSLPKGWLPFLREAELSQNSLSTGLNALTKANHMEGGYYNAFFNISNGLERLLKLVFIIHYATENAGAFPTNSELRVRFSHDLRKLFAEVGRIRQLLEADGPFRFSLVDEDLSNRIINVFAGFSQGAGRYYNLDYLTGSQRLGRDPIEAWATEVASHLLQTYPGRLRRRDASFGELVDATLGPEAVVLQTSEWGTPILNLRHSVTHASRVAWVQSQATFHCATIVRHIAEVLEVLTRNSRPGGLVEVPGLWEFFVVYLNEDRFLKGRRTFLR